MSVEQIIEAVISLKGITARIPFPEHGMVVKTDPGIRQATITKTELSSIANQTNEIKRILETIGIEAKFESTIGAYPNTLTVNGPKQEDQCIIQLTTKKRQVWPIATKERTLLKVENLSKNGISFDGDQIKKEHRFQTKNLPCYVTFGLGQTRSQLYVEEPDKRKINLRITSYGEEENPLNITLDRKLYTIVGIRSPSISEKNVVSQDPRKTLYGHLKEIPPQDKYAKGIEGTIIKLYHDTISRIHATFAVNKNKEGYVVHYMDHSSNGSVINGNQIKNQRELLKPGSIVKLGHESIFGESIYRLEFLKT